MHVVTRPRPDLPAAPAASQPAAGSEPEKADRRRQDIAEALQALARQVSELQSDNERLRGDNDRLNSEIGRIRAFMQEAGREIVRRASELLAGTED